MRVEIYSDVICPWCYIGKRRFERALAVFREGSATEVEVVYRPFQLDPGAPTAPLPLREYLTRRFGTSATRIVSHAVQATRLEGIEFDIDRALAVNTFTAHRLLRLAEHEYGLPVQRALADRLFEAHFARGENIGDVAFLVEIAVGVGMDEARVRDYLGSIEGRQELCAEFDDAHRDGVTSVPTFVFDGRYALQGAQQVSVFLRALQTLELQSSGATADGARDAWGDDGSRVA